MATFVYKDAFFSIDSNDLSSYIQSCSFTFEYEEVEVTAMGDDVRNAIPGLINWSFDIQFKQSMASGELDAILWPLVGAGSKAVVFRAASGAKSTSNPEWTGNGQIFSYPPLGGSVGDGAKTSITVKPADGTALARATS